MKELCTLNGGETESDGCTCKSAHKYKEEEISQGCAICCFDSAESYRWSKIVLPVRKTITFRHLFLSERGPQLYLSLNNLRLCFFPPFFVIFPSTALRLSCSQVAGIKGVFLSNKVVENQVKTYITYNKGRDWRLLQAPTTDLQGNKVYCEQVSGPLTGDRITCLDSRYLLRKTLQWMLLCCGPRVQTTVYHINRICQ